MAESPWSAGSKPSAGKVFSVFFGFVAFLAALVTVLNYFGYQPRDTAEAGQASAAASVTASPPTPPSPSQPEAPAAVPTGQATGAEALYVSATLGAPYALGKDRGIACPDVIGTHCLAYEPTVEDESGATPGGCYLSWQFFKIGDPEPVDSGRITYCSGSLFVGREGSVLSAGDYELVLRVELDDGSVTTKKQPISLEL